MMHVTHHVLCEIWQPLWCTVIYGAFRRSKGRTEPTVRRGGMSAPPPNTVCDYTHNNVLKTKCTQPSLFNQKRGPSLNKKSSSKWTALADSTKRVHSKYFIFEKPFIYKGSLLKLSFFTQTLILSSGL